MWTLKTSVLGTGAQAGHPHSMALNKAKKKTWYFKTKFSLGVVVHACL
jgi:general stress protein 26